MKAVITQELLQELLDYNPETGELRWKERGAHLFNETGRGGADGNAARWNANYAGKPALDHIDLNGYKTGSILGYALKAHRAIMVLVTGTWPEDTDHINGNRTDNRLINLRAVSRRLNSQNQKLRVDCSTGHYGVQHRPGGRYRVTIGSEYVGTFGTMEAAVAARREAEMRHGYHPNHGRAA